MVRLMLTPLFGVGALVLLGFAIREWFRRQSRHEERHGRRTKEPELVSAFGWNLNWKRGRQADGIRLRLEPKWGLLSSSFCIPRKLELSHILLMEDTGSGKSNAIRQILHQVEERGESAIVYDPAAEFVQEFYRPERGDLVLNPLDERCPYWSLPSEFYTYGIADAIAAAMLPEKEHEPRFLQTRRAGFCPACSKAGRPCSNSWSGWPTPPRSTGGWRVRPRRPILTQKPDRSAAAFLPAST
jgi:hypothetical protein